MNRTDLDDYEWHIQYAAVLLRQLLGWKELEISEWTKDIFAEPDELKVAWTLHAHPADPVIRLLAPARLWSRLGFEAQLELEYRLHRALVGDEDPDFSVGGDWNSVAKRLDHVLATYGESLASVRHQGESQAGSSG